MALNYWMHPRNIYKDKKPDFKELANRLPEFHKHVTKDAKGSVHLDFKNPECLRALTVALLKVDFDLDVELPLDRLIPTVPLRLNYILWLEDILGPTEHVVRGVDIGTGSSCIYPLIGSKKNGWHFLASETDEMNLQYAKRNVARNNMEDKITVVKAPHKSILQDIVGNCKEKFDFCMCNPPFYSSNLEAWGTFSRHDDRAEPPGVSTACEIEGVFPGGEVQFAKLLIADSDLLQNKIRIYTTMLGKKSSVKPIKIELLNNKIYNFTTTEFCQGRTMRWGVAWSFDKNVVFPKPFSKQKKTKSKAPLQFIIPLGGAVDMYNVEHISTTVKLLLDKLSMEVKEVRKTKMFIKWEVKAYQNTWSHQRRKRRQERRASVSEGKTIKSSSSKETGMIQSEAIIKDRIEFPESNVSVDTKKVCSSSSAELRICKNNKEVQDGDISLKNDKQCGQHWNDPIIQIDNVTRHSLPQVDSTSTTGQSVPLGSLPTQNSPHFDIKILPVPSTSKSQPVAQVISNSGAAIITCKVIIRKDEDHIVLEMKGDEGDNRENMHQVLQYIKNSLTRSDKEKVLDKAV